MVIKVNITDSQYPRKIKGLKDAPSFIYYVGDIKILEEDTTGVIGSRHVSKEELTIAYNAGRKVAEKGSVLVNGLAIGCDTAAVQGALDAGGKIVAVMPCGLNEIYPKSNEKLAKDIVNAGGCIVSEYAPTVRVANYHFVRRDRIQAITSNRIIVISSDRAGGTMHTVGFAREYSIPLGCVCKSEGCRMLVSGNHAIELSEALDLEPLYRIKPERQLSIEDIK